MPSVEAQLAWAAGLFEGEGWFTRQRPYQYPVAAISMTDRDVVERFREVVGWRSVWPVNKGEGNKIQWRCATTGYANVERFGQLIRPYLGERRTAQLDAVLVRLPKDAPAGQLRLVEEG